MSTTPTRPGTEQPVDEETRRIVEERLAMANDQPRQDLREAIQEIRERRKLNQPSPK